MSAKVKPVSRAKRASTPQPPQTRAPATLNDALAAVRKQDFGAARDALVDVWRGRRSPELAELVDLLDRRAPDALTAQLAAIITPRVITSHAALRQLAVIDDPRVASFALDALVNLPFTAETAMDFLLALVATVSRLGDSRVVTRADAIRTAMTTRIGRLAVRTAIVKSMNRAIARLPALAEPSPADRALEAALAKELEPLRATTRSAATLLADIYANPEDDAPRLVYADLLLEQGDPRGELITIQIERARQDPVPEPGEREQELLKKHGKAWLGSLAPVLSWGKGYAKTTFRRGFVSTADIILSVGKKLRPILTDPAWATVEKIKGLYTDRDHLLELAPLNALRELEITDDKVAALAARVEPLSRIARLQLREPVDAALLRKAFPSLITVWSYRKTITLDDIARFAACGTEHVELAHYHVERPVLAAATAVFDVTVASLIGTQAHVAKLTLVPPFSSQARPKAIELRRNARRLYERVT